MNNSSPLDNASGEHKNRLDSAFRAINAFSGFEQLLFFIGLSIVLISGLIIALNASKTFTVEIPSPGGTVREGIVGTPRFINPLISFSDADRDMVDLIYSGLLKSTDNAGVVPDLAEGYTISPDGKVYTFVIRQDAVFHDGTPLTADDVVFTIERAQDPFVKSSKRPNWEGVLVEKVSDYEVRFTLKQPYAPFIENMTLGILPKHLWQDTNAETFSFSEFNTEPIGSGPFKIKSIKTNGSRVPVVYELVPFADYTFGKPYLNHLIITFYKNETELLQAFENGDVDNVSTVAPDYAKQLVNDRSHIETTTLPRVFGLFFNQNQSAVFTLPEVRNALNISAPRQKIVSDVLLGYGSPIEGPIPPGLLPPANNTAVSTSTPVAVASTTSVVSTSTSTPTDLARKLLEKNGWKLNAETHVLEKKTAKQTISLEFSISTSNTPDLKKTAEILKEEWEKLGAKIEIKTFDMGDLNQSVIRPRKYDALLFGEIVGRDLDLFAFWHSSQRNDPGLNIALYTNSKVDKLLEDARVSSSTAARFDKYRSFETELAKDVPAVFLYSPDFIYIISNAIDGFSVSHATVPSERFGNINLWHTETDRVWKFLANQR